MLDVLYCISCFLGVKGSAYPKCCPTQNDIETDMMIMLREGEKYCTIQ